MSREGIELPPIIASMINDPFCMSEGTLTRTTRSCWCKLSQTCLPSGSAKMPVETVGVLMGVEDPNIFNSESKIVRTGCSPKSSGSS